ncbi:hypothetical protein Avbf_17356 [Armadillidium vulgare]|nr:hypothetical protein Avbf_17356 [Armadillidium vulgare]
MEYTHPITNFTNLLTMEGRKNSREYLPESNWSKRLYGMMSLMITFIITMMFCHFQLQTNKFYIILCNAKYYTKQSLSDDRSSLSKTTLAVI